MDLIPSCPMSLKSYFIPIQEQNKKQNISLLNLVKLQVTIKKTINILDIFYRLDYNTAVLENIWSITPLNTQLLLGDARQKIKTVINQIF